MEPLQWNETLATGIEEIDEQHRQLFAIVNQLRAAIERGESAAAGVAIREMLDYTVYHFEFEETLLEKSRYKMLSLHQRVHQLFVKRTMQFQRRFEAGEDVLVDLHGMLARWLVSHIQNEDRDYAPRVRRYLRRAVRKLHKARPHTDTQPLPLEDAAEESEQGRRSLWGRLSGFMTGDF